MAKAYRRLTAIALAFYMLFSLTACGDARNSESAGQSQSQNRSQPAGSAGTGVDSSVPTASDVGSASIYGFGDEAPEARGNLLCNDANEGSAVLGDGLIIFRDRHVVKTYNTANGSISTIVPESDRIVQYLNYWEGRLYFCQEYSVWSCLPDGSDLIEHFPDVPVRYFFIVDSVFYIYSGTAGTMVAIDVANENNVTEYDFRPQDFTSLAVGSLMMVVTGGYIYYCVDEYVLKEDDMVRAFPIYRYNILTGESEKITRDFVGLLDFEVLGGKLVAIAIAEDGEELKTYIIDIEDGSEAIYEAHMTHPVMVQGELFDQLGFSLIRDPLGAAEVVPNSNEVGGGLYLAAVGEYIYYNGVGEVQHLTKYDGSETIVLE